VDDTEDAWSTGVHDVVEQSLPVQLRRSARREEKHSESERDA
jgi:hypothetical protein